jgi:AcrR family transcriptional regulator
MAKRPIDRRVARSRETLHQALLSLIIKKGYDAITVEDICETANVGRSTFYAHFTGKDDLKRSGLEHLREQLLDLQRGASADKEMGSLGFSLTMFEHARDHIHLYRALMGSRGGAVALGTIRRVLCDCIRGELAAIGTKNEKDGVPNELIVEYVVGGYMAMLTRWLDGGAKLPPAKIDAIFRRLAIEGIASLR